MNTYNALTLDKPLIQEADGELLFSTPPRKTVVAIGVSEAGAPFKVEAPGFPDVTDDDIEQIFGRHANNELSEKEEADFNFGWEGFLTGLTDDNLNGFQLLGWTAAMEHYADEIAEERQMFAQTVNGY